MAHVLSDIHLEMDRHGTNTERLDIKHYFDDAADILFLLGDIGNVYDEERYWTFVTSCSRAYKKVFVILGNHELYGTSPENAAKKLREQCKAYENVVFLNRDTYDLDLDGTESDIRVAGTTLWSRVEDEQLRDVRCFIADHRTILGWSVEENNYAHEQSVKWLRKEADRAREDGKKLVVISHHAPILNSCPKHRGSPLSSAFETDLTGLIRANPHIVVWMHGHTHHSYRTTVGETLVVSNQYGYDGEATSFDRSLVVELQVGWSISHERAMSALAAQLPRFSS